MKSIKKLRQDADKRATLKNKDGSPIHYNQKDEAPVIGENIDVHGEWAAHHEGSAQDHQQAAGKHENAAREAQADGETHLARRHQAAADLHDKASRAHTFAAKLRHNNASFYAQNRASRTAKDLTGRADSISKRLFRINEMAEHSKYHEWLNDVMKKGASKFEDHHTSLMGIKDAKRETHKHTLARNQSGHIVGSWNHRYGSGISEAVELFEASPEYQKWKEGVTSQHGDTVRFSTKPKHTPEGWNYVSTAHKHNKVVDTFLHSHRAAVLAGKHGEAARQKAMAVESLEELYPIFEEHGVFEAIDPATIHSVVGGVAGLAAGARGAYYAAKHTKEKFGEKTHKVLGRYVKNFAKGIAHPFKEDVDHFHIDISRHVDRMANHLHAQASAPHELAHKAHFNDEHEAIAKKHGHEAARYAGIAAHAKAKGNEGSAQATIAGAAKYARAHHGLTESNVRTLKGDQSHVKHIGTFEPGTGYAGAKVVHNAKNKSIEIHHLGRAAVIKRMVDKNPDYPSLISHMKGIWGNRLAGVKWHVNEEMTSEANYSKGGARKLVNLPGRKTDAAKTLDTHIAHVTKGLKVGALEHGRYVHGGGAIPNVKQVPTAEKHQKIFDHLKSHGYKKTGGFDPTPHSFSMRYSGDQMRHYSEPVHHPSGISAHVSQEHGSHTKLVFTHNKMNEETINEAMPSGIIKHKQKLGNMTDSELATHFRNVTHQLNGGRPGSNHGMMLHPHDMADIEHVARQHAWRHGYGQMSAHYWNRIKPHLEKSLVKEETLIEAGSSKKDMKRKYLGKSKGRTKVGTRAHGVDTEPKITVKDNASMRIHRMPQPVASKGIG